MPDADALLAREFALDDVIHLDHAGVGPWPRRCAEAVKAFADTNARVSYAGQFEGWMETDARLRARLCRLIGAASPDDIALLKNTSEGLSQIAHGIEWRTGDRVVALAEEFNSNKLAWQSLARRGVEWVEVEPVDGQSREDAIEAACDERTRLVSVSTVQYGTGVRMDIDRLGAFCKAHDILFCIDAVQSLGALRFDIGSCAADFVVAGSHKWLMAPFGIALFWCRPELRDALTPLAHGWHTVSEPMRFDRTLSEIEPSARRFEPGTANWAGLLGFEASLSLYEEIGPVEVERRVLANASALAARITERPGVSLITPREVGRHGGSVCISVRNRDHADLAGRLQAEHRVLCAARGPGLRFSPHCHNTAAQLDAAVDAFDRVVAA